MKKPYQLPIIKTRKKESIEEIFDEAMQKAGFRPLKVGPADASYQLMSGEEIDLGILRGYELEYIESLEEVIGSCEQHDRDDFFYVSRKAANGVHKRYGGVTKNVINLPFYKVIRDMVTKYGYKCGVLKK
ncbi:MAG: hypothetical protein KKA65_03550 [Nanoarchaeota archaeon]|nr:hypothetical protein [Nanoarchaeota archaeon]MBU4241973.1 hypothetical protein [Nanoarchaeota archaeon]MBU4352091.1 hypothetical protein [Nanoarchaeota archaeon]MBU4456553.1 hypothetical protein [Nanoarchaeota archaeon]MCG2719913.1 hypothetical protein [Nanoarchaeota archaeon]